MKVARYEVPGIRNRDIRLNFALAMNQASLREVAVFVSCPGNKLPGYYREVPPGQESTPLYQPTR
jgi:hypothetical protein